MNEENEKLHLGDVSGSRVLRLTLKKCWFDLMISGEKTEEYRRPSQWIKSRLFDQTGSYREYDFVEFKNGYGKNVPCFTAKFRGVYEVSCKDIHNYKNGLNANVEIGDFAIMLGDVVKIENVD